MPLAPQLCGPPATPTKARSPPRMNTDENVPPGVLVSDEGEGMFHFSRTDRPLALLVLSGHPNEAKRRRLLAHMFQSDAVGLSVVATLEEARQQLRAARFDAVVVDRQACSPACLRDISLLGEDGVDTPILMLPSIGECEDATTRRADG